MILEQALLQLIPGREADFERAFAEASAILERQRGHGGHRLERCCEDPSRYLLLVEWATLADHVEGFRGGPDYPAWKALLHDFYDPFPEVLHFETVLRRAP